MVFFPEGVSCYKNTDASSPLRTLRRRPASAGEGYFASLPTSIVQVAWWGVRVGSWAGLGGGARRPSGWLDIAGWSCRIDLHLSRAARLGHLAKGRWSGEEGRGMAGRAGAILPIALGVVLARWGGAVGAPRRSQLLGAQRRSSSGRRAGRLMSSSGSIPRSSHSRRKRSTSCCTSASYLARPSASSASNSARTPSISSR